MKRNFTILFILLVTFLSVNAQNKTTYNYAAQKKLIPVELGKVYLGMPFNDFAKMFDLSESEVGDTRFDWFQLSVPIEKGNVKTLKVRIHGLTPDDKSKILKRESVVQTNEFGSEYNHKFDRLLVDKIPAKGFVYAMYIEFNSDFDLKTHVIKTYGKDGDVRKPDDPYRFYDIQWGKKSSDGLGWMIRSFHEGDSRSLQLLGEIDGTEWGNDD